MMNKVEKMVNVFLGKTKVEDVHQKNTILGNKTSSSLTEGGGFVF